MRFVTSLRRALTEDPDSAYTDAGVKINVWNGVCFLIHPEFGYHQVEGDTHFMLARDIVEDAYPNLSAEKNCELAEIVHQSTTSQGRWWLVDQQLHVSFWSWHGLQSHVRDFLDHAPVPNAADGLFQSAAEDKWYDLHEVRELATEPPQTPPTEFPAGLRRAISRLQSELHVATGRRKEQVRRDLQALVGQDSSDDLVLARKLGGYNTAAERGFALGEST